MKLRKKPNSFKSTLLKFSAVLFLLSANITKTFSQSAEQQLEEEIESTIDTNQNNPWSFKINEISITPWKNDNRPFIFRSVFPNNKDYRFWSDDNRTFWFEAGILFTNWRKVKTSTDAINPLTLNISVTPWETYEEFLLWIEEENRERQNNNPNSHFNPVTIDQYWSESVYYEKNWTYDDYRNYNNQWSESRASYNVVQISKDYPLKNENITVSLSWWVERTNWWEVLSTIQDWRHKFTGDSIYYDTQGTTRKWFTPFIWAWGEYKIDLHTWEKSSWMLEFSWSIKRPIIHRAWISNAKANIAYILTNGSRDFMISGTGGIQEVGNWIPTVKRASINWPYVSTATAITKRFWERFSIRVETTLTHLWGVKPETTINLPYWISDIDKANILEEFEIPENSDQSKVTILYTFGNNTTP